MNIFIKDSNNEQVQEKSKLDSQLKLKIFQCLKENNTNNSTIFLKRCLTKILHLLFLKNIITSKSNNRIIDQYFKKFLFNFKTNKKLYNKLNSAFLDTNYNQTLIINSIYELLNNTYEL